VVLASVVVVVLVDDVVGMPEAVLCDDDVDVMAGQPSLLAPRAGENPSGQQPQGE
jgi:hypothetical protein